MSKHVYEQSFFNYLDRSSSVSAQYFLEILDIGIPVNSVLDVGCGRGAWLAEWRKRGVEDVQGVDGHYVDTATLLVPGKTFITMIWRSRSIWHASLTLLSALRLRNTWRHKRLTSCSTASCGTRTWFCFLPLLRARAASIM